MPNINQSERARLAWSALTSLAAQSRAVTYSELGAVIGIHHRAVKFALDPIQTYCIEEKLPPLTILVAGARGRPGRGFIAHDLDDLDAGLAEVWSYDWRSIPNPFDFAAEGRSFQSIAKQLVRNPEDSEEVYRLVKSRGIKQLLFRTALLSAYSEQCAFSGIEFYEVLEACHIVPWRLSTDAQRMDVRNGLLLNSFHHRLFDHAHITITPDFTMMYADPSSVHRNHSRLERSLTVSLHGKQMTVPRLVKHRPLRSNIEQHNALVRWDQ